MNRLETINKRISIQKDQIKNSKKAYLKQIYENYLHSYETRTDEQIKQTTQNIKNISKKNLQRLTKINQKQLQLNKNKFNNFLFICLSGIPPFPKQFQFLNLPGKVIHYVAKGFQFTTTQQQRIKLIPQCRFEKQADRLNQIIQQHSSKTIVLIYHSFGTYLVSSYLFKHGADKIKGLIQLGPAPIRHYKYLTEIAYFASKHIQQDLIQKMDTVIGKDLKQLMIKINQQLNIQWDFFPTNSLGAAFMSYFKSNYIQILFDLNRRYPNLLKLIIFGQQDNLFENDLICERAQFYRKQNLQKQNELKINYQKTYHTPVKNIQQQFIYQIPKAKHSLHMQKKNKEIIKKAVYQYLKINFMF